MEVLIELERAMELVTAHIHPVREEVVDLSEAFGRVLAEDVCSPLDIPGFTRSPLDGYAYRATELDEPGLNLRMVCEIPAGVWPDKPIGAGEAAKIFTGAPIPEGANCVVRVEDTEAHGELVTIHKPVMPGKNIVPRGDEIMAGSEVLESGALLTPAAVGLLAAVGVQQVKVYRKPCVGILSTGTELCEAGKPLAPGKIYNSNSYTLRGLLQEAGCEVKVIPLVGDRMEDTVAALESLADTDMVITTGGASVGEYDLMREALARIGCEMLFWKVDLKPGTPAAVGVQGNRLYFSLSGNPAAAMVTFELLVRPVLHGCAGRSGWQVKEFPVKMASGFGKGGRQRRFLRAQAIFKDGEIWAEPSLVQSSGVLKSMIGSHLLVDVPTGHGEVVSGETLNARWIANWEEF